MGEKLNYQEFFVIEVRMPMSTSDTVSTSDRTVFYLSVKTAYVSEFGDFSFGQSIYPCQEQRMTKDE